jgi:hypothetical protein
MIPKVKEKTAALLTYEEIGILPIKDFDYINYDKVYSYLFRTGAVTVEVVTQVTSPKGHGVPRLFAQCITSAGSRPEH